MTALLGRLELAHRGWRYRTRVDPDEIRWLRAWLRPGDTAVDVGAYKGGYTYWMRRAVGDRGTVLAFEPQPALAEYLERRVSDFGWKNVDVVPAALSSEPGQRTLLVPGEGPSPAASLVGASLPDGAPGYAVETQVLDQVLERRGVAGPVRLIKCDVEGHELEVLRGAERTLRDDRPAVLLECEPRHLRGHGWRDVFASLESLGYRGSFFWRGRRLEVRIFEPSEHQVQGRRPYANNFVFVPGERGRTA